MERATGKLLRFNITQMRDWLKCPQYSHNLHIDLWGPLEKPVPLDEGSLFHEMMDAHLSQVDLPDDFLDDVSDKARDSWDKHKLWLAIESFTPPDDWIFHSIEGQLSFEIFPGVTLDVRPDAIVEWNRKYWSLQWKTYTGDDRVIDVAEHVRLSYHEVAYQYVAEANGFRPWGGTILGACQKLPGYRMIPTGPSGKRKKVEVTDDDRAQALSLHYLMRSPETQRRMFADINSNLLLMYEEQQWQPRRNYDSCWINRVKCPFFDVCHNDLTLSEPNFIKLNRRYSDDSAPVS